MELSALMDFPDDARHIFYESTMYAVMERLGKAGVTRVYLQYSGDFDFEYKNSTAAKDSVYAGFRADYPVEVLCLAGMLKESAKRKK